MKYSVIEQMRQDYPVLPMYRVLGISVMPGRTSMASSCSSSVPASRWKTRTSRASTGDCAKNV
ncbi:putative integrase core domain protein (plasmid) [Burkholderia thailandensis 34]|nr:putative integrase core domain protein [Burkholderia thailandensis 34]